MSAAFFTIAARNYVHFARALAATLAAHHPEVKRILVVVDASTDTIDRAQIPEFDRIIGFEQIGLPSPTAFSFRYDALELSTAVKPFVFSKLLAEGHDRVVYLDPDIQVYRPLTEVFAALDGGASTVLTPHSLAPLMHAEPPNDHTFLRAGAYNLGFMAVSNLPQTHDALRWWQTRLEHECVANRMSEGVFVDQKFMDLWPSYCADTHILRDPTYNLAYWNLDTRALAATGGGYTVDGRPLAFYHFSGIVPGDRTILSRHQRRWTPNSHPALRRLLDTYQDALDRHGRAHWSTVPYGFGAFRDGTAIPKAARILFREQLEPFANDPFEVLAQRLLAPAPIRPNPLGVVTQLMHTLWAERPDLQRLFSLDDAASQLQFSEWYVANAAAEADIAAAFIEPTQQILKTLRAGPGGTTRSLRTTAARSVLTAALRLRPYFRGLYRHIPSAGRRRVLDVMLRAAWPSKSARVDQTPPQPGLCLIGYPFAETGVGEAMRALARSVATTEVPFDVVNFDVDLGQRQQDRALAPWLTEQPHRQVNVFCINADMIGSTMRTMGAAATDRRYNIIRPFWELPNLHPDWRAALSKVDEVWAPTQFVKAAFEAAGLERVVHVPVAIDLPPAIAPDRAQFNIPEGVTAFLFAFDFSSYPSRKNPQAVLEAYRRAFGADPAVPVALVIKTMGQSPRKQRILADIAEMARRDPRIILIDRVLTRDAMHALTASIDVFVSLHRSEGFGLGMAEAMAMGKSVIATDYSGSTDFVRAGRGMPVPYRLIDVRRDDYPYYVDGQHWADPDLDAAAAAMRELAEKPALRDAIGSSARAFMAETHSPAAVGLIIRDRLAALAMQ